MNRRLSLILLILASSGTALHSCKTVARDSHVDFVDRVSADKAEAPLALIVGIDGSGKLTLNQIGTGTISEPSVLVEKLTAILVDRKRSSIYQDEVLIELGGSVAYEDIDALIAVLKQLQPTRITIVTRSTENNPRGHIIK